jgi:hypothetical protein
MKERPVLPIRPNGGGGSGRNDSFLGVNSIHHQVSHHQSDPAKQAQLQPIDR